MLGTIAFYITVNEGQRNKQTWWTTKSIRLQGWLQGYKVALSHGCTEETAEEIDKTNGVATMGVVGTIQSIFVPHVIGHYFLEHLVFSHKFDLIFIHFTF